jgi:pyroglutamyl-peptidase
VLLSGFEAFDGEAVNPSAEVVQALAREWGDCGERDTMVLPVDCARAAQRLLARVASGSPDLVIMLGEAGGRARVTPERVAINVDDYRIPDNAGNQPRNAAVVDGGPVGYFSTLPLTDIVERLHAAGIAAEISNSAGTYLCNHLFYRVMHGLARSGSRARAGFIHLPYLPEQVRGKAQTLPSMALGVLVRAVRIAVDTALATGDAGVGVGPDREQVRPR